MIKRMPWFERVFSRDLPLSIFPNVVERIRGTTARLEERVKTLSPEELTRREGGSWSIQENAGHLLDLEPLWLGRVDDLAARNKTLRPADLENRKTHEADHNSRSIDELLASFRSLRRSLTGRLDAMDSQSIAFTAEHPRLKTPMNMLDLIFFTAEHDDHHLARITELLRR